MSFYTVFLDSVKLFFMNAFLYVTFLEFYFFFLLTERLYGFTLPFFDMFFIGITSFTLIVIWMVMAKVWGRHDLSFGALTIRTVLSELPFIIFIAISWLLVMNDEIWRDGFTVITALTLYLIAFPIIMAAAQSHHVRVKRYEHTGPLI